jgi:hypothetical protein
VRLIISCGREVPAAQVVLALLDARRPSAKVLAYRPRVSPTLIPNIYPANTLLVLAVTTHTRLHTPDTTRRRCDSAHPLHEVASSTPPARFGPPFRLPVFIHVIKLLNVKREAGCSSKQAQRVNALEAARRFLYQLNQIFAKSSKLTPSRVTAPRARSRRVRAVQTAPS